MSDPNVPMQQAGDAAMSGDPMGAIEIKASFFVLAFLLYLFPAKASINGSAELSQGWGTKVYPMPAGQHQVRVWCPYFGVMKMGDATHVVDVYPGHATVVEWKCPWLIFLPGAWVPLGSRPLDPNTLPQGPVGPYVPPAEAAAPAAAIPAGWHPDPQGVAALRYWDGQQWTEHTNDGQGATG